MFVVPGAGLVRIRISDKMPLRSRYFLSDCFAARVGVDCLNAALERPISERQAAARARESVCRA